jgi:hypothetical protein
MKSSSIFHNLKRSAAPALSVILSLLLILMPVAAVSANEGDATSTTPRIDARMDAHGDMRDIRVEAKAKADVIKKDAKDDRRNIIENAKLGTSTSSSTKQDLGAALHANAVRKVEALKENMDARKKALEARRVELKAQIDKIKAEQKDARMKKLDEKAKERVAGKLNDIYKNLDERIARLTKVDVEVAARITKIGSSSVDISAAAALLVTAQTALSKAKTDVDATKAALAAEANASTSKEAIRALVKTAEDSIKAAGAAYQKVIEAIKALPKPAKPENPPASTTPSAAI